VGRRAVTWVGLAVAAAVVAACTSNTKDEQDPNIVPAYYKQELIDTLLRSFPYPARVRGAFVSEPALTPVGQDRRYAVCVRYDARDTETHYAGSKDKIGYFYGGHLNQLVDATPQQCGNAAYKPFLELEKLCMAVKCF
jgi:hypothetical protein